MTAPEPVATPAPPPADPDLDKDVLLVAAAEIFRVRLARGFCSNATAKAWLARFSKLELEMKS